MLKVGIIDSGVNVSGLGQGEFHIKGISISKDNAGHLVYSDSDLNDYINHGTVCAKIIQSYVSDIELFIVKIFDRVPFADEEILTQAIQICLDEKVDIINISLGIQSETISDKLMDVCDDAYSMNIPIVAANHNDNKVCFPAYYPKVFGVGDWEKTDNNKFKYINGSPIEFFINGEFYVNDQRFYGSSFACPKITGELLNVICNKGKLIITELKKEIISRGEKSSLSKLFINQEYIYNGMTDFEQNNLLPLANKYFQPNFKYKFINSLLVLPLYDSCFQFLEKIDIDYINKEYIILKEKGSFDQYHTPRLLSDKGKWPLFDTIAIGNLKTKINVCNEKENLAEIEELIRNKKNFMVFDDVTYHILCTIKQELFSNIEIYYPKINQKTLEDFERFKYLHSFKTPLIAVIGVGNREVISVQCYIYKLLKKAGYAIEHIVPVAQGEIMSACFSYPLMHPDMVDLQPRQKIRFLKYLLKAIQAFKNPDILITGIINSIVPNILNSSDDWGDPIGFLSGIQPDGLIVTIYATDTYEGIINNVFVAKSYTKARVLCFLFMEKCGNISSTQIEIMKKEAECIFFSDPEVDSKIKEEVEVFFTMENDVLI